MAFALQALQTGNFNVLREDGGVITLIAAPLAAPPSPWVVSADAAGEFNLVLEDAGFVAINVPAAPPLIGFFATSRFRDVDLLLIEGGALRVSSGP